jgi:hypothetical protein
MRVPSRSYIGFLVKYSRPTSKMVRKWTGFRSPVATW